MTLYTPKFRVSFPNVFAPDNYGKFSITMLIPKNMNAADSEKFENMKVALKRAKDEKWPDKSKVPPNLMIPIKDGDRDLMMDGTLRKEKYPEVAGNWIVRVVSGTKPGLLDESAQPIGDMNKDDFYSGCYAHATIHAYAYGPSKSNPQIKPGVGFGLDNVQKLGDGDAFSGKPKAQNQFSAITDMITSLGDMMDTDDTAGTSQGVQQADNFLD